MSAPRTGSCLVGHKCSAPQKGAVARWHDPVRVLLCALSLIALLLAAAPASAQTMSTDALLASPAALAFAAGRFADALRGLEELETRYPDDVTIKRLKGMALYNLERYGAAANTFRGVVALDPKNAAAQFWLGAAQFKTGAVSDAYAAFQRAVSLAPESAYGLQSAKFIEAIDKQVNSRKQFSVEVTGGVQHDDNVSLANTNRLSTYRFFQQVGSRYYLVRKPGWFMSVQGGGYFSQNTSSGLDSFGNRPDTFDLVSGTVGVDVRHETSAFGIPVAPGLNYTYNLVDQDYSRFSDIHTLTGSLEVNPKPDAVTRLYQRFSWDLFADDGTDPAIFSRDGTRYTAGVEQFWFFNQKRHYVWGGYEYVLTDTQGTDFDARAHKVSGGFSVTLIKDLVVKGTAQYSEVRYVNYIGPVQRRSQIQSYIGELIWTVAPELAITLGYAYTFDKSTIQAFETRRNIATLAVTRRF